MSAIRRARTAAARGPRIAGRPRRPPIAADGRVPFSEFAGRHEQYEKFYGGAAFLVKQNMYRSYDFAGAGALVDHALALPE